MLFFNESPILLCDWDFPTTCTERMELKRGCTFALVCRRIVQCSDKKAFAIRSHYNPVSSRHLVRFSIWQCIPRKVSAKWADLTIIFYISSWFVRVFSFCESWSMLLKLELGFLRKEIFLQSSRLLHGLFISSPQFPSLLPCFTLIVIPA